MRCNHSSVSQLLFETALNLGVCSKTSIMLVLWLVDLKILGH